MIGREHNIGMLLARTRQQHSITILCQILISKLLNKLNWPTSIYILTHKENCYDHTLLPNVQYLYLMYCEFVTVIQISEIIIII